MSKSPIIHGAEMHRDKELSSELVEAYRDTDYVVSVGGNEHTLNVARPLPPILVELIESKPIAGLAVITAYNPYSVVCNDAENRRWQAQLKELLSLHGYETLPALGVSSDGTWEEPSLAVLGISHELANAFGCCFRQNAIIHAKPNSTVELVICDKDTLG